MAKNQEKLEAQKMTPKEKRAEKKDQREKELQAETDLYLRKYLEVKDSDPEAAKNREYWRQQYFNAYSMTQFAGEKIWEFGKDEDKVWELNIEDYKSRMAGNGSIFNKPGSISSGSEGKSEIKLEDLIDQRAELKKEIEATETSLKTDHAGLEKIVQDFYDQNINPESLLASTKDFEAQGRAIRILFATNPQLGEKIIMILSMKEDENNKVLKKSAEDFIRSAEAMLVKRYKIHEETRMNLDTINNGSPSDFLKGKLKNSIAYFKDKPIQGILGVSTIVGLLYWCSQGKEGDARATVWSAMKGLGIAGAIGYGVNTAFSIYNDDGKSALDMIFGNPEIHDTSAVVSLFKADIEGLTGDDRNAVDALLKIANTDADNVFDVFEDAQNSHTKTINPTLFLSLGGVSRDQAKGIRGDNLYIGLETVMKKLAGLKNISGSEDEMIRAGKIEFKKITSENPGMKFVSLMILMEQKQYDKNIADGKNGDGTPIESAADRLKSAVGLGGGTTIAPASGESGSASGGAEGGSEKKPENPFLDGVINDPDKKNVEGAKDAMKIFVDEQYARLDKYVDSYWVKFKSALHLGDKFRSVVKQRKLISIDRLNEIFKDKTDANPGDLKKDLTKFTSDLKLEIDDYCAVLENRDSNSETVINDLMSDMVKDMMGDEVWEKSADYVFKTINGRFELEGGSHLFDDPEILVSFMRVYFEKIEWGRDRGGIVTTKDAQDYADFFLDRATKLVVDSPNISLDNFDGKTKEISTEDWTRAINNLGSIDDFEVWAKTKPLGTKLEENDAQRAIQRRESEKNTSEREKLLDREEARIDAAFNTADKLDWGLTRDQFEAFIGRRKQTYIAELAAVTGTGAAAEKAMDLIVARAEAEGEMFRKYAAREGHNTPTVLMEVQREMIEKVVPEKNWQESAVRILNYTSTSYEKEGITFLLDEPEISVQLMDLYYKNIDNGSSKESNADVQAYTDYFLYELTYTLANDKNISATNLDGYVKQISTKEWGQVQNKLGDIQTFDEWKVKKLYRPELKENDQGRAVIDRIAEEGTELDKYLRERIKQIDVKFAEVEDLDSNILPDNFDAFISMRRQSYDKKLADTAKGRADIPATRAALDAIVSDAQKEVLDYLQFKGRASSSPVVLLEAEKIMLEHELGRPDWKASAEKVLQFANSSAEFENRSYVIDDPQLFADYIKVYQSKIEGSAVGVASKDAEDYTRFFLFKMDKVLPNDKNYAIGSARKQISQEEWMACKNKMDAIPEYNEWMTLTPAQKASPELVQNDLDRAVAERIKEEKKASTEAFMQWFDKEMDPSTWFGFEGQWPEEFRKEVESKLEIISNASAYPNATNEEYQKTLQEYARYVKVEKRFFELMIEGNVSPDQISKDGNSVKQHMLMELKKAFDANFNVPGKTARDYHKSLDGLGRTIVTAQFLDTFTVQFGKLYIPVPDLINFYPGGT